MSFNIVALVKQVPDTQNVGKDAMREDGTVNRSALPVIVNPEDLKSLEMAVRVKESIPDSVLTVISMGPPRAADVLREALYRGADRCILLSDAKFAGSDTLATSYAISLAIKKLAQVDIVFAGRQAIDGDTAQVGPQIAEKLGIPQITYAEEIVSVSEGKIVVKRRLERGVETVGSPLPVLVTVHGSAPDCRYRNAARILKYNKACTLEERSNASAFFVKYPYLEIKHWSAEDLEPDFNRLGITGSPTKVKNMENVVLSQKESFTVADNETEISAMVGNLIDSHIID